MKIRIWKRPYYKKSGKLVKPHTQTYTYRDFAKFRLKKILDQQKGKKNVKIAMKQMGREWKKAKTMAPIDIKKTYGSVYNR